MPAGTYVPITEAFVWSTTDTAADLLAYVQARVPDPANYTTSTTTDGGARILYMPPGGQISGWSLAAGDAWTPGGVISASALSTYAAYPPA